MAVYPIPNLSDNYIWLITNKSSKHCVLIDMGEAGPAVEAVNKLGLKPTALLLTHHHWDHSQDTDAFRQAFPDVKVYGAPRDEMPKLDVELSGGETLTFPELNLELKTISTPGHTRDAMCYYNHEMIFTGDTLFAAGCGRLFEGTPEQMHESLQAISKLGDTLKVYCGHEYTAGNLKFAHSIDPKHVETNKWIKNIEPQTCTLPSTIAQEKKCNPFLRAADAEYAELVSNVIGKPVAAGAECLGTVRALKDSF